MQSEKRAKRYVGNRMTIGARGKDGQRGAGGKPGLGALRVSSKFPVQTEYPAAHINETMRKRTFGPWNRT